MAPVAVKTLASSFEGLGGATALSVIAFSVVFIVLIGLTLVIFAMRLVSKLASGEKKTAPVSAPAKASAAAPAASDDSELIAVIAAAIFAQTGTAVRIKSVVPAGTHMIGVSEASWINCGRLEGLQGALSDRWN